MFYKFNYNIVVFARIESTNIVHYKLLITLDL